MIIIWYTCKPLISLSLSLSLFCVSFQSNCGEIFFSIRLSCDIIVQSKSFLQDFGFKHPLRSPYLLLNQYITSISDSVCSSRLRFRFCLVYYKIWTLIDSVRC